MIVMMMMMVMMMMLMMMMVMMMMIVTMMMMVMMMMMLMMMPLCTLMNISNLIADDDARSMTPSRNTRSYTLRSVPSSPGRLFLFLAVQNSSIGLIVCPLLALTKLTI